MADAGITPVLLAAGAGSRFHGDHHKLLAELPPTERRPGERIVDRALAAVVGAGLGDVVVVTGRLDADELGIAGTDHVRTVHNERWADGQMTSVQAGLAVARERGSETVVIGLADQPGITSETWHRVATHASAEAPITVASYGGVRGNPVALHQSIWHLVAVSGDAGARGLMRIRGDLVVPVSCQGQPHDIDTVEDLHRWQNN